MLKVLLISAYDALSHRRWRMELANFLSENCMEVHQAALPSRHYAWRSQGNALTLAFSERLRPDFDLVIATSMTNLAVLKGIDHRLAGVPSIVYFHENQFAFPSRNLVGLLERQLTSIYNALSADTVVFNSQFNQETFLSGVSEFLQKMPDGIPAGVLETIEKRSVCLPVAINLENQNSLPISGSIVWNHRWEYDKGPDLLFEIISSLVYENIEFEFSLLGQQFRSVPDQMSQVISLLRSHGRLRQVGFIESEFDYYTSLNETQIVLSTSKQEFQGLSVQDALAQGCLPVVPNKLCYPEYVPAIYRYDSVDQATHIVEQIIAENFDKKIDLTDYSWSVVGSKWLKLIEELVN